MIKVRVDDSNCIGLQFHVGKTSDIVSQDVPAVGNKYRELTKQSNHEMKRFEKSLKIYDEKMDKLTDREN